MRILQICSLITPNGAYGGPVRVAVNQTRELLQAGHEVTLLAGSYGFGPDLPKLYDGIPVSLFPARRIIPGTGFAGLTSAGLLRSLRKHAADADVLHIHLARDFITLPAARWARKHRKPYIVQPHGMVDPSSHPLAVPLDAIWTRPVLRDASNVLYLTEVERAALAEVARTPLRLLDLGNGVPAVHTSFTPDNSKAPEVLFLARLHPRKRPLAFITVARALSAKFSNATFRLVGPDEGEGAACVRAIKDASLGDRLRWEGPVAPERTTSRLEQASIYVLPSIDEPFPMSVLEAMSLGKPVVVTNTCGLADVIRDAQAGIVVDDSLEALTDAVSTLLADPQLRRSMGHNGFTIVRERFSMQEVQRRLQEVYRSATTEES